MSVCENGPGLSGWLNMPPPDELWCGCGIIYDCCGVIVPVECAQGQCNVWDSKAGSCRFRPAGADTEIEFPEEYKYLHEFLFRKPISRYGKSTGMLYGHDWIMDNPPPCLSEIPLVGREK